MPVCCKSNLACLAQASSVRDKPLVRHRGTASLRTSVHKGLCPKKANPTTDEHGWHGFYKFKVVLFEFFDPCKSVLSVVRFGVLGKSSLGIGFVYNQVSRFQCADDIGNPLHAVFKSPALQPVDDLFGGAGIPEICRAHFHGGCAASMNSITYSAVVIPPMPITGEFPRCARLHRPCAVRWA